MSPGLWYAFTVGAVRVISIANDDVVYQDGAVPMCALFGRRPESLAGEGTGRRSSDRDIDWIVVCMHQVAISTADMLNGADLGIRQEWVPLFDNTASTSSCVDTSIITSVRTRSRPGGQCHPDPIPMATATDVIDTSRGTVHMIIGCGEPRSVQPAFLQPAAMRVITAAGPDPATGRRPPVYVKEHAPWSAVRNATHAYGFAAFTVDPGRHPGDFTTMKVTYYDVTGTDGRLARSRASRCAARRDM